MTADIEKAILGRKMNAQEAAELASIREQYTADELINAVQKTAQRRGRSMAYLRKVLQSGARAQDVPAERFAPTHDLSEIEQMLDEEFWEGYV